VSVKVALGWVAVGSMVLVSCSDSDAPPLQASVVTSEVASKLPTSTTVAPPTSVATPPTTPAPDPCRGAPPPPPVPTETAPAALVAAVGDALFAPRWGALDVSGLVWVEGYGVVGSRAPDAALLPASNQKLFTAIGAHLLLAGDRRFTTEVRRIGSTLVLRAGGDPTLTTAGPHSLDALADQVRGAVGRGPVRVVVDAGYFEAATMAAGWQDWHVPTYVGPMSALIVDDNRIRTDADYVSDPARGNGERFADRLRRVGVAVDGPVEWRRDADGSGGTVVARLDSAPVDELLGDMLRRSDNEIAESLLREIGGGSTADGVGRIDTALGGWCLGLTGTSGDGSGLSRDDFRSAGEWVRLLQAASTQPWGDDLLAALPVAGRSGTLAGRLGGLGTAGNVWAKTGTIIGGQALSGYARTISGRAVVFSVIVNGEPGAVDGVTSALDGVVVAAVRNG